jgi:hypothetical protein
MSNPSLRTATPFPASAVTYDPLLSLRIIPRFIIGAVSAGQPTEPAVELQRVEVCRSATLTTDELQHVGLLEGARILVTDDVHDVREVDLIGRCLLMRDAFKNEYVGMYRPPFLVNSEGSIRLEGLEIICEVRYAIVHISRLWNNR